MPGKAKNKVCSGKTNFLLSVKSLEISTPGNGPWVSAFIMPAILFKGYAT